MLATAIDRASAEDALRRSEEHFRSLIENALDIVTVVGEDGTFQYASPSVERLLGYRPGELLQRNAFQFVHPDDLPVVAEALARAIKDPAAAQMEAFRFRHRNGGGRAREAVGQARGGAGGGGRVSGDSRGVAERNRPDRGLRGSKR